jgi:formate dehydrogenase (hydrogenase)
MSKQVRLTQPLVRTGGEPRPAWWDEAMDRAAAGFAVARNRDATKSFGMFSCSEATNEMNYAAQRSCARLLTTTTICPYCGVGCNLELHVQENRIVKVTSPLDHDVGRGHLCDRCDPYYWPASAADGHCVTSTWTRSADSRSGLPRPTATPTRKAVRGAAGRATPCAASRARSSTSLMSIMSTGISSSAQTLFIHSSRVFMTPIFPCIAVAGL